MIKIIKSRRSGKTTQLIQASAQTKHTIVCFNKLEADRIINLAKEQELEIPEPITFTEFKDQNYNAEGLIIDNADEFLRKLAICPITIITMSEP